VSAPADAAVVLYDAACPLCRQAVTWISRRAVRGDFEFLPCQAAERRARFPRIEDGACMQAMHLVLPDGRVLVGAGALPEIVRRLRRWGWLASVLELPGIRRLSPHAYAWVARHRYQLSATCAGARAHR